MIAIIPCEHCGSPAGMDFGRLCVTCGKLRPPLAGEVLQAAIKAWRARGGNYTDEFIAEIIETFRPTQYGRAWQKTAALAVDLLRAASVST